MSDPTGTALSTAATEKHSITLVFGPEDKGLYDEIVNDAKEDDRPTHKYLLRYLKNGYSDKV